MGEKIVKGIGIAGFLILIFALFYFRLYSKYAHIPADERGYLVLQKTFIGWLIVVVVLAVAAYLHKNKQ